MGFIVEGLYYVYIVKCFFQLDVEIVDVGIDCLLCLCYLFVVKDDQCQYCRYDQCYDYCQLWMDLEYQQEGVDKGYQCDYCIFWVVMGDFVDFFKVVGDVGDQFVGVGVVILVL